jgi:glycosyltransferase involved in cell wall biosynthesis
MFEYFAAGVPVIASDFPLWRTIVAEHECGLLVDPSSPVEVAAALAEYARKPEMLSTHSRNARRLAVEQLNWQAEGKRLVNTYDRFRWR